MVFMKIIEYANQLKIGKIKQRTWAGIIDINEKFPNESKTTFGIVKRFEYKIGFTPHYPTVVDDNHIEFSYPSLATYYFNNDALDKTMGGFSNDSEIFDKYNHFVLNVRKVASKETSNLKEFLTLARRLYEKPKSKIIPTTTKAKWEKAIISSSMETNSQKQ
ncbi:MAG: hypothetical protein ACE5J4_00065 [Candidatus Aenigmatarchaeota archaeon]